jgi:hypothetical protein
MNVDHHLMEWKEWMKAVGHSCQTRLYHIVPLVGEGLRGRFQPHASERGDRSRSRASSLCDEHYSKVRQVHHSKDQRGGIDLNSDVVDLMSVILRLSPLEA